MAKKELLKGPFSWRREPFEGAHSFEVLDRYGRSVCLVPIICGDKKTAEERANCLCYTLNFASIHSGEDDDDCETEDLKTA